jgi:ABC-type lipoprotein release transport system permease subunit
MSDQFKKEPPKWANRLLRWYCNPELLEQIQGDIYELFYWRAEEKGIKKAKRSFAWDVFRLFRWSNIRRTKKQGQQFNQIAMFKNYFKIGLRNLWKQRMPSTINIIGLALAVGCSLVSFKWIESSYVKDNFHKNGSDTFLVTHLQELEGNKERIGSMDESLSAEIIASVAGIENFTRYNTINAEARVGTKTNFSFAYFVDESYLDIFNFKVIMGNPNALKTPGTIILDESNVKKFFGDDFFIGQQLEIKIGEEWKSFSVGAVVEDRPNNSSLRVNILINYEQLEQLNKDKAWQTNFFIQRQEGISEEALIRSMNGLLAVFNANRKEGEYVAMELEPLQSMALNSYEITDGVGNAPEAAPNILLASIAGFMLILATFNYINISLAMMMKRLKEIGIRKVIGSNRRQLIAQFLTENLILCALSITIGVCLAGAMFLPWFNNIAGGNLQIDILNHFNLWLFLGGLLVFITLVSGLYPAIVASRFKPVSILKKEKNASGNKLLSSVFMTFQMILAMITIVGAVMSVYINKLNEKRDWGYDQYGKLTISVPDPSLFEKFRAHLEADPDVIRIAGTKTRMGRETNSFPFTYDGEVLYSDLFDVGYDIPEIFQMRLKEGRMFDQTLASDVENALLVNETFIGTFRIEFKAEGVPIMQDSIAYTIVGVVEDYHYWSFGSEINAAAMRVVSPEKQSAFVVEMVDGDIVDQEAALEASIEVLAPDYEANVFAQEGIFDSYFEDRKGIRNVLLFTSSLAVLLAAMGLYGLVNINISTHLKDFGIRKVLGATGMQLAKPVFKRFRIVIGLAIVIGGALSVLVVGVLMDSIYTYSANIGAGPLAVASFILLSVAFLTLNLQINRVKKLNPADTLRTE